MSSIRRKLKVNENDSKNTRMDLASAGVLGNWRPDELAHMSRFDKIASLAIEEAKLLGRPLDTLEIGCGECWSLRVLYKAYVIKKSDVIRSYYGYDIDPACELDNRFWSNGGGELKEELERNFRIEAVTGTFIQMPKLKKAMSQVSEMNAGGWSIEQLMTLQERFGKQFLRMAAAVFYPEIANNCAWRLVKK